MGFYELSVFRQVSRFLANLKCTLETALNYAKEKRKKLADLTGAKGQLFHCLLVGHVWLSVGHVWLSVGHVWLFVGHVWLFVGHVWSFE